MFSFSVARLRHEYRGNLFLMLLEILAMEEVFWSLEEENNTDPGATVSSSPASSQQGEHVIHGSPLWLIAGIAVVLVIQTPPIGVAGFRSWCSPCSATVPSSTSKRSSSLGIKNSDMLRCLKDPATAKERELMLSYTS